MKQVGLGLLFVLCSVARADAQALKVGASNMGDLYLAEGKGGAQQLTFDGEGKLKLESSLAIALLADPVLNSESVDLDTLLGNGERKILEYPHAIKNITFDFQDVIVWFHTALTASQSIRFTSAGNATGNTKFQYNLVNNSHHITMTAPSIVFEKNFVSYPNANADVTYTFNGDVSFERNVGHDKPDLPEAPIAGMTVTGSTYFAVGQATTDILILAGVFNNLYIDRRVFKYRYPLTVSGRLSGDTTFQDLVTLNGTTEQEISGTELQFQGGITAKAVRVILNRAQFGGMGKTYAADSFTVPKNLGNAGFALHDDITFNVSGALDVQVPVQIDGKVAVKAGTAQFVGVTMTGGTLSPGGDDGAATIKTGPLSLDAASSLRLAKTDKIEVDGELKLDGTLVLLDTLDLGESIQLISASSVSGTFAAAPAGFEIDYSAGVKLIAKVAPSEQKPGETPPATPPGDTDPENNGGEKEEENKGSTKGGCSGSGASLFAAFFSLSILAHRRRA